MNLDTELLDHPIARIGRTKLTVEDAITAIVILVMTAFVVSIVSLIVKRLQRRVGEQRASAIYIAGQITRYIIVFIGIMSAVSAMGINLSSLSLFAGAIGVGVGLGLQDIIKNFTCGIVLLFDRSIEVGDYIELDVGVSGQVAAIGPRATTILTNDNVDILMPNANLLNSKLTNWTRNQITRRVHIPFSVAYGSDKDEVRSAALEAAKAVPFTLPDEGRRRTQVWLTGFGDSALNFSLLVWPTLEAVKRPGNMMAAYYWALDDALCAHNIEIPFPQRDIHVRGFFGHEGDDAINAYHNPSGERHTLGPRAARSQSQNDAANEIDEADKA